MKKTNAVVAWNGGELAEVLAWLRRTERRLNCGAT